MIQKCKNPDTLKQKGPVSKSTSYKNNYLDFYTDYATVHPIPPVEKQLNLDMKF